MATDDREKDAPSLEPPSLGFGRKRRKTRTTPAPDPAPASASAPSPAAPAPAPAPAPVAQPAAPPKPASHTMSTSAAASPAQLATPQPAPQKRRPRPRPSIGGVPAAVLTGLLVGALGVGLTWASFRLCEVVKGTSSCGNPGFLLLAAILLAMVLLGGALLRAFAAPDPGSTSFLAVGLLAVIALLFLVDVLFSWTMIIVIPLVAAATYALSWWVTTAFIEPAES